MERTAGIDPWEIEPLHEPRDRRLLRTLATAMRKNGWEGRPILVVNCAAGYLAWTGSHRIAAARNAGLEAVPCYIINEQDIVAAGYDARAGHIEDYERLAIVRKLGDEDAINLMWQENRV